MFYLMFLLVDGFLAWTWWRALGNHREAWRTKAAGKWRTFLMVMASLLMLVTALLAGGLTVLTVLMVLGSSKPSDGFGDLAFIMLWVPGLFLYSFTLMLTGSLHVWARKAYEEAIG